MLWNKVKIILLIILLFGVSYSQEIKTLGNIKPGIWGIDNIDTLHVVDSVFDDGIDTLWNTSVKYYSSINGINYKFVFCYDAVNNIAIPLTYPLGQTHYWNCYVAVYEYNDSSKSFVLLCMPFASVFTEKWCFENDPENLIYQGRVRGMSESAIEYFYEEPILIQY